MTASNYSHIVTVIRTVPGLGNVEQQFKTTADAVSLHSATLTAQVAAGKAVSFSIASL